MYKLEVLISDVDAANMPPSSERGNEGPRNASERGKVAPVHEKTEYGNHQLEKDGRPGKESVTEKQTHGYDLQESQPPRCGMFVDGSTHHVFRFPKDRAEQMQEKGEHHGR